MGELPGAVRAHRAAAVLVRIDQRSERGGALEPWIEPEPDLAQHVEIGTEAGADNHFIDLNGALFALNRARDLEPVTMLLNGANAIRRDDRD